MSLYNATGIAPSPSGQAKGKKRPGNVAKELMKRPGLAAVGKPAMSNLMQQMMKGKS